MNHAEIIAALRVSPAFHGVAEASLRVLSARSRALTVPAGSFIFERDHRGESCWLVVSGLIQITSASPRGRPITIDLALPGDLFGRTAGVAPEPGADAAALVASRLAEIPAAAYQKFIGDCPAFRENLLRYLGRRLRECHQMRALAAEPARVRILWTLLKLRNRLGPTIPLTRRVLADIAGIAPETCIRVLSPLEKAGILRSRKGSITLRRPERLEALLKRAEKQS